MFALKKLQKIQEKNKSMICLGLDLDPKRMPSEFTSSSRGMFDFVKQVVEATKDHVCAYKPNLAFYENMGTEGLSLLRLVVERIPEEIPVILDGKRGDISNTAVQYSQSLFDKLGADWVTVNPYMGYDSMRPFIERKDKGVFVLCLTSNAGSRDFQQLNVEGKPLYMVVADRIAYWNKDQNCGLVVGATHPQQLAEIRRAAGDMPLLIPGVGAQGGALEQAVIDGTGKFTKTAVINVSRSVLYASNRKDFAERASQELQKLNSIVDKCRQSEEDPEAKEETIVVRPDPQGQDQQDKEHQTSSHRPSDQPSGKPHRDPSTAPTIVERREDNPTPSGDRPPDQRRE